MAEAIDLAAVASTGRPDFLAVDYFNEKAPFRDESAAFRGGVLAAGHGVALTIAA